jgi:hypothetical protein
MTGGADNRESVARANDFQGEPEFLGSFRLTLRKLSIAYSNINAKYGRMRESSHKIQ